MKSLVLCATILAACFAAPASAEIRYDRKLEQAVMAIVAKKMGDLRGAFSHDIEPAIVTAMDRMTTGSTGIETARFAVQASRPDARGGAPMCKVSRIIPF